MDITIYDLIMPSVMVAMWMIIRAMSPSVKKLNFKPLLGDLRMMVTGTVSCPVVVLGFLFSAFKAMLQAIIMPVKWAISFIILAFDAVIQIAILIKDFITLKE